MNVILSKEEGFILEVEVYGQKTTIKIPITKENFYIEEKFHKDGLELFNFIIDNFYSMVNLKKDTLAYRGNHNRYDEMVLNVEDIDFIFNYSLRSFNFYITKSRKIRLYISAPTIEISSLIIDIKKIKNTFSDKNYKEIIIKELEGINK